MSVGLHTLSFGILLFGLVILNVMCIFQYSSFTKNCNRDLLTNTPMLALGVIVFLLCILYPTVIICKVNRAFNGIKRDAELFGF